MAPALLVLPTVLSPEEFRVTAAPMLMPATAPVVLTEIFPPLVLLPVPLIVVMFASITTEPPALIVKAPPLRPAAPVELMPDVLAMFTELSARRVREFPLDQTIGSRT